MLHLNKDEEEANKGAPAGDDQEPEGDDVDLDDDEDESEYEQNEDPFARQNRWAEPHGLHGVAGQQNGFGAHIARQRQLEAEIDQQIEAQIMGQLGLGNRMDFTSDPRTRYGEPGMNQMGQAMMARGRTGPGARNDELDLDDIQLKENGEIDLDNMNEAQLMAHMMRLQAAYEARGGNLEDLGESSQYSESVQNGDLEGQIQRNPGGVMLGSSEPTPGVIQKGGVKPGQQTLADKPTRDTPQSSEQRAAQNTNEAPDSHRQLQSKRSEQALSQMNGNFSIPIPRNPDEELGWKFDKFTVSLSVAMVIYVVALGILIYFVLAAVDNRGGDYGVKGRSIPGSVLSFIHQECRGPGAAIQTFSWQSNSDISDMRFGPCNHVYAKIETSSPKWNVWNENSKSWKPIVGLSQDDVERVDPQGNLWFLDRANGDTGMGLYNISTGQIQNIKINTEKLAPGADLSSVQQLTFRDGYIFALSNLGILVWQGDTASGHFNMVKEDSTIKYIRTASPSQIQDLVTFHQEGGRLRVYLTDVDKTNAEAILTVSADRIAGIARPVFSNDFDQTFLQTKDTLYQIMTNTRDRVETIKYALPDGPLMSPVVNKQGQVFHKVDNQWQKKTFKFQAEATYESLQSKNLNRSQKVEAEEPERNNLLIIGMIIVIFIIGGSIGFAWSRYSQYKNGTKEDENACSQKIGTANDDGFDLRISGR